MACLHRDGLAHVSAQTALGEWRGQRGPWQVIIDGPYKSAAAAQSSVAGLQGIEIAAAGGIYEVTAALRSNLTRDVTRVAACMAKTTGT